MAQPRSSGFTTSVSRATRSRPATVQRAYTELARIAHERSAVTTLLRCLENRVQSLRLRLGSLDGRAEFLRAFIAGEDQRAMPEPREDPGDEQRESRECRAGAGRAGPETPAAAFADVRTMTWRY